MASGGGPRDEEVSGRERPSAAAGPPEAARAVLVGRHLEQAALASMLDSVRSGLSSVLVLRGEAGIGKTALLEYAVNAAADLHVVRVVGIESEMELGFAALHQLVRPFLPMINRLPGPQQQALASAFGLADGGAPDRFLVGLAILTLLSEAAKDRALLCVIDDAQWLDRTSAAVVAFVGRRLHADRIAFLLSVREPADRSVDLEGLRSLTVGGLSLAAAGQLLSGLVAGSLDRVVGQQIIERAAGNPLALVELTRELTEEQLAGAAWLPDHLPVSADIQQRFWRQAAALPPETQDLLLLAAAEPLGDLLLFERAADFLGLSREAAHLGALEGLVSLHEQVTFRHPLIRSAIYRGAPIRARRRVHAAIAAVSDKEADPDRIAWHLAAAAGSADEEIAAALERSADSAKRRGGLAAEAAFLRRAAELTPDHGRRAERLLGAAEAEFTIGGASRALVLIDRANPHLREPGHQAAALKLRGTIQSAVGDGQAAATLLQAAQKLAPLDPQAARGTMLEALVAAFYSGTRARNEAVAVARTAGVDSSIAGLLLDGYTSLLTAGPIEGAPLLRRAVGALLASDLPSEEGLRWFGLGMFAAVELFDFDAWHVLATRWVTLCREKGALMTLPLALDYLGTWETFTGRLDAAEVWNAEGRDLLSATGNPDRLGTRRAVELLVPTWRGHADGVREAATALIRDSVGREQGAGVWYSHYALAVLEISVGNYEVALANASVLMEDNGPYFGAIILPEAAEAAVHCGDRAMADLAVERLAVRARAGGTDLARGLLARCQALTSPTGENEAYFVQAIQHLERCRAASEVARSHLLFGEWLRRQRRRNEARQHLRAAYESFEVIGALKFAERAGRELAATGAQARKRTVDSGAQLTVRETQIARLVATGATNAEVATQLFISSSTVEYHLRHVFQKRGVTSRTMLAAVFRDQAFP
jgi:DNA-binding CsgD family transcriptional regulator